MSDDYAAEAAIRKLKYRYCKALDDRNIADLVGMFHADAHYEAGSFGGFDGADAAGAFLGSTMESFAFSAHIPVYGLIEVNGDTATAEWRAMAALRPVDESQSGGGRSILFIRYDEQLVREDGRWLFKNVRMEFLDSWPIGGA